MSKKSAILTLRIMLSKQFLAYNRTFKRFKLGNQEISTWSDKKMHDYYERMHIRCLQFASMELHGDNYSLMRYLSADDQYVLFELALKRMGLQEHARYFKPYDPNSPYVSGRN